MNGKKAASFQGFSDREIKVVHQTSIYDQTQQVGRGGRNPPQDSAGPPRKTAQFHHPAPRQNTPHAKKAARGGAPGGKNFSGSPTTLPQGTTVLPKGAYFTEKYTILNHKEPIQSCGSATTKTNRADLGGLNSERSTIENNTPSDRGAGEIGELEGSGGGNLEVMGGEEASSKEKELPENPPSSTLSNLERLREKQEKLENENKKTKALVEHTLQERYQRSQLEARTLQSVKKELERVENLLTRDIAILRDRIEEAEREYMAARKRYDLAETEFVAAKLSLHKACESKELLSEHLYTIIQQNEFRKAEKLAEILKTLGFEGTGHEGISAPSPSPTPNSVLFHKTPTPGTNIWPQGREAAPHCKRAEENDTFLRGPEKNTKLENCGVKLPPSSAVHLNSPRRTSPQLTGGNNAGLADPNCPPGATECSTVGDPINNPPNQNLTSDPQLNP